ncbi:hypothetical protein SEVIR_2G366866v4 [Setaria viridis]
MVKLCPGGVVMVTGGRRFRARPRTTLCCAPDRASQRVTSRYHLSVLCVAHVQQRLSAARPKGFLSRGFDAFVVPSSLPAATTAVPRRACDSVGVRALAPSPVLIPRVKTADKHGGRLARAFHPLSENAKAMANHALIVV